MRYFQHKEGRRGSIAEPLGDAMGVGIQWGPESMIWLKFRKNDGSIWLASQTDRMIILPHGATNLQILTEGKDDISL